jgi:hypothetical protein
MKIIMNLKVNLIYWWRHNEEFVINILTVLTFPIWFPVFIILVPFMVYSIGDPEEDEKWCKEHGLQYPWEAGWDSHKIVKKWRKEYKRQERLKEKELIRKRLLNEKS